MPDWSDAEELSGRKAFDLWRFADIHRVIPWDWADLAKREKRNWIELAGSVEGCPEGPGA